MSTRSDRAVEPPPSKHAERARRLRAQLDALQPADGDEAQHLAAMRTLLDGPGDPFARDHYAPGHFTASAFILSTDRTRLLLILHGKLGRWLQPGGHIDPSDTTVEAAARREVHEETGLADVVSLCDGPFDLDVHPIPPLGTSPAHAHFDVRFLFEGDVEAAAAGSDARAVRLFALDAIDEAQSDRSVLRAVGKLRRGG